MELKSSLDQELDLYNFIGSFKIQMFTTKVEMVKKSHS